MGFEDRQYYRDGEGNGRGIPGFQFNNQSIVMSLIIVNVAIFLLDTFTVKLENPGDGTHWLSHVLGMDQQNLWKFWTWLTHGFAHASLDTKTGIWHIAGNMLTLFFLGRPVEQRIGRFEFLKFYLIATVVAGLGWAAARLIFDPQGNAFIVGASGAVSAVVVLFIFMYPREQIYLMGVLPIPAWALGVLLLVTNVMHALDPNSHIAWEAHLIGALFGLMYYKLNWRFDRLQFGGLSKLFGGPKLRVHDPEAIDDKLQQEADAVLAKISEQGESSLTGKERRILKRYSKNVRKNRNQ